MAVLYGDLSRLNRTSRYGRKIFPAPNSGSQLGEECLHRRPDALLVDVLVGLPERLRVIGSQIFEELESPLAATPEHRDVQSR